MSTKNCSTLFLMCDSFSLKIVYRVTFKLSDWPNMTFYFKYVIVLVENWQVGMNFYYGVFSDVSVIAKWFANFKIAYFFAML